VLFISKKLVHFERGLGRGNMKVSELSFPFCLPSGRLSEAEKNSVRLKENRGECYKALDATGIFVDT